MTLKIPSKGVPDPLGLRSVYHSADELSTKHRAGKYIPTKMEYECLGCHKHWLKPDADPSGQTKTD